MLVDRTLFHEEYAAAQSLKNGWTRLASTYGCMMVTLSSTTLIVKPHWFAKWLIVLLQLDLCHEIAITSIKDVKEKGKWFNYGKVEIQFETANKGDQKIFLYIKKEQEFMRMVTSVIHL